MQVKRCDKCGSKYDLDVAIHKCSSAPAKRKVVKSGVKKEKND